MSATSRKRLLIAAAILFAGATVLYSGLWIYSVYEPLPRSPVELGFETDYVAARHCQLVSKVYPDTPAAQAGLQAGDCVVALNGEALKSSLTLTDIYSHERPGDRVEITVERSPRAAPVVLHGIFRAPRISPPEMGTTVRLLTRVLNAYPVLFLVIGLTVLFLRVDDRNAWLLALVFGGFIGVPSLDHWSPYLGASLIAFARGYHAIFDSYVGAIFYFFFAVFPVRSPLDRRAPWLKWAGLVLGLGIALPGLREGTPRPPETLISWVGANAAGMTLLVYIYGFIVLGLISLIATALAGSTPPEARRKTRVILWGTLVGVIPILIQDAATDFFGFSQPFFLHALLSVLLFLFPLSFAYAVLKHRVLDIPILLKRSARYLAVQRGFTILLTFASVGATLLFANAFAEYLHPHTQAAMPTGIALGAGFGILLLMTGTRVHKNVGGRIDRAFFRSAYDARQVLENLAQNSRHARQREPLARLMVTEINEALHPSALAVYFLAGGGRLVLEGSAPAGVFPPSLSTEDPLFKDLQRSGEPMDVLPMANSNPTEISIPGSAQPECLVPLLGDDARLTGIIALGARLSEEPYSREDKRLLASVASQAGAALETIHLGEEIAERIAAERRSAQEMEFAREVQNRLFPQKLPALGTLEYTGKCIPTREVGGDYYDFLELRPGRVALVLADIAGKGVSGALLMANLQANLRSQYALALEDLSRLLNSVNHLFFENTSPSSYATLFFGDYDDSTRRFRYANCGHLPPLLLRACPDSAHAQAADPALERLTPTGTVVGLFDQWECSVGETRLAPGDTLVLYTDGVTEAENALGEEFGEARLADFLRCRRHLPVDALLDELVKAVQDFSAGHQADDITVVVARCRT